MARERRVPGMKLLFASDSMKGTLSSEQTIQLLTKAAEEVFGECECEGIPVADGGREPLMRLSGQSMGGKSRRRFMAR